MSELSKVEIATIHLRYKLENSASFDRFSSLGMMTVDDLSENVLNDIYSTDDVSVASVECVKSGHLNAMYIVKCLKCKGLSHVEEVDLAASTTMLELINDGPPCHHCSAKLSQDPSSVDLRFVIPQKFIPEMEEDGVKFESSFARFLRWLGFGKQES